MFSSVAESAGTCTDLSTASLIFSWSGSSRFQGVEKGCPLEPNEVEDLRCGNDYPPNIFPRILETVQEAFPSGR
ncbi:unnamed protein product [Choristocarpus tenellus]